MPLAIKKGYKQLLADAEANIETITAEEAISIHTNSDIVLIDIRDVRELKREGSVPGSHHMPRGMLEFWVDPDSPYHKEIFASGKKFVFYCARGWRSTLATQAVQQMGLTPVCHVAGGFNAWKEANGPIETKVSKSKQRDSA
ncbi:rhodanese-like domain-containing protein [Anaerolineales bacterium HSG25]|nr:rhodanese-like domain-containing protein [Anaerolineales bacterium HSG25]